MDRANHVPLDARAQSEKTSTARVSGVLLLSGGTGSSMIKASTSSLFCQRDSPATMSEGGGSFMTPPPSSG